MKTMKGELVIDYCIYLFHLQVFGHWWRGSYKKIILPKKGQARESHKIETNNTYGSFDMWIMS